MATIYELTEEYRVLLELAEDPEVDPETLADTLEALGGEIEEKADGYAKVMKQLEADAAALKFEEKRLSSRRTVCENNIKRMKAALQAAMEATGKKKFKTDLFSFGIQKNPAKLVIDDDRHIPHDFMIQPDPVPNNKAIRDALNEGFEFGWCHLEQTESLRIR